MKTRHQDETSPLGPWDTGRPNEILSNLIAQLVGPLWMASWTLQMLPLRAPALRGNQFPLEKSAPTSHSGQRGVENDSLGRNAGQEGNRAESVTWPAISPENGIYIPTAEVFFLEERLWIIVTTLSNTVGGQHRQISTENLVSRARTKTFP